MLPTGRFLRRIVLPCLLLMQMQLPPLRAQESPEMPADYSGVLAHLGRKGDFKAGVLKVGIPRSDLQVTVDGFPTPTSFGFGGWVALTKGDKGRDVMMGDLVLLEEEVNPVISALLANGLEITAIHNHFFWEQPRIFYMHVHGFGRAEELARKLKPALDLIGRIAPRESARIAKVRPAGTLREQKAPIAAAKLAEIIGHPGEQNGPVTKFTIGRDDLKIKEMGAVINARMGLNTWAAFTGSDEEAVVAGDVAMLAREITPVVRALRAHGLDIVAMHHHMTDTKPMVFFLHYWGRGKAEKLAEGFRAALDMLGKSRPMRGH